MVSGLTTEDDGNMWQISPILYGISSQEDNTPYFTLN
jgi:hypothetical protein